MNDWSARYASRMSRIVASDIRERMKLIGCAEIIQLGGGLPDPVLFPTAEVAAATARILGSPTTAAAALQYAPSEGHGPLRAWVAADLTARGAVCDAENVMITNGSQQALDFVGRLFLSRGDTVALEIPSFIGALRAFDSYEPRYVELPTGAGDLPAGAKFGYLGPDFRNPTGTSLSRAEREALVEAAGAAGLPLLEDACYERLRYDGEPVPSLLVTAAQRAGGVEGGCVLQTGTFSKTLAPSLRVGWIAGPSAVIRKLVLIKQAADLATSALNQMIALEVATRSLDALCARARDLYRDRRDSMLAALGAYMPPGVAWTRPEGGLYVWLTLPDGVVGGQVAARALTEHFVSVISGAAFYPIEPRGNTLRLSFSLAPEEAAREGVRRLGGLLADMIGGLERGDCADLEGVVG